MNLSFTLKRLCVFSMEIERSEETFKRIYELLRVQRIYIEEIHLIRLNDSGSRLIFHTRLEMDRIRSLKARLDRMKKVSRLECLYDQQRNKLYK